MYYEDIIEGKETDDETDNKVTNTALYYLSGMNFIEIYCDMNKIKEDIKNGC